MIGEGKALNQIAEEIHVSVNTVRTYRTRILEKIGVKGTSELIHYAITHRLAE
jgi:two-component system invasion response regulator UvrY